MRSVELFSGCGGLALGLSHAGFVHDLLVEWDSDAVETISFNKKRRLRHVREWPLQRADVREIDWKEFSGIDLVAGGPPCQPFSIGGKHKGFNDSRDMWPQAIRAVRETKPSAFLFENVRGLARPAFAPYLRWIIANLRRPEAAPIVGMNYDQHAEMLESAEQAPLYEVLVIKVNAADYGAPQKRHRVIVAGVRADLGVSISAPAPTHSRERLLWDQWVSGDYWKRHGIRAPKAPVSDSDRAVVERMRKSCVPPRQLPWVTVRDALTGLGDPTGVSNHVLQSGARVYPGHTGSLLDQPAKALKAGDHGVPGGENMMVRDDGSVRYFTIREAARLQGLPDTYQFPTSWTESMRQLGNAVPTQLSAAMGCWIRDLLAQTRGRRRRAA